MDPGATPEILAAGGLVVRKVADGVEVAVVHRPAHGDWSLPKGKLEAGESAQAGALREVEEETGWRCRIGAELEPARYRDRKGRSKEVRFFLMSALDGEFSPGDEVDELRWLAPADALEVLDHEHDRRLVQTHAAMPG